MPEAAAGTGDQRGLHRLLRRDRPGGEAQRALHAEPGSRRCTSACAPAASIVPAATSATSENATSSEMTIPAAWESSIAHARAGDELELADAERDRPRLRERHVGLRRVVEPQQRDVRPRAPARLGQR